CFTSVRHCFFFSSRRRHTRSLRDWSSDVCSSDLDTLPTSPAGLTTVGSTAATTCGGTAGQTSGAVSLSGGTIPMNGSCTLTVNRSEERRVGKECRYRSALYH